MFMFGMPKGGGGVISQLAMYFSERSHKEPYGVQGLLLGVNLVLLPAAIAVDALTILAEVASASCCTSRK